MKVFVQVVLFLVIPLAALPGEAYDHTCRELQKEFEGGTFIAIEPLYDTVIGYAGIIKLERDKEEIHPGSICRVKEIECGSKNVEATLKQVAGTKEFNKVQIKFRIHRTEREAPEGMEDFRKMWAYVLEDVPQSGASTGK